MRSHRWVGHQLGRHGARAWPFGESLAASAIARISRTMAQRGNTFRGILVTEAWIGSRQRAAGGRSERKWKERVLDGHHSSSARFGEMARREEDGRWLRVQRSRL